MHGLSVISSDSASHWNVEQFLIQFPSFADRGLIGSPGSGAPDPKLWDDLTLQSGFILHACLPCKSLFL